MELTLEQKKANRKLWVEELRSGRIKQGRQQLERSDGSMCCLGVLSKLAGCERDANYSIIVYDGDRFAASQRAREWVGLNTESGSYGSDLEDLASDNDGGKTFAEIADIIESEPKGLFNE